MQRQREVAGVEFGEEQKANVIGSRKRGKVTPFGSVRSRVQISAPRQSAQTSSRTAVSVIREDVLYKMGKLKRNQGEYHTGLCSLWTWAIREHLVHHHVVRTIEFLSIFWYSGCIRVDRGVTQYCSPVRSS